LAVSRIVRTSVNEISQVTGKVRTDVYKLSIQGIPKLLIPIDPMLSTTWHFACLSFCGSNQKMREARNMEESPIVNLLSAALVTVQSLVSKEDGQDLVEYALVVALIAFATTAGMRSVASGVNTIFTTIGSTISSATT
jgi:pilus assembly protein Flp/PilA